MQTYFVVGLHLCVQYIKFFVDNFMFILISCGKYDVSFVVRLRRRSLSITGIRTFPTPLDQNLITKSAIQWAGSRKLY